MIDVDRVKIESKGRWGGIYQSLGIDVGTGKHGPCPLCGGEDRFRCDNKTGMGEYICGQCGAGDGLSMVQKALGIDFIGAVERVAEIISVADIKPDEPSKQNGDPRKNLNRIWKEAQELTGSDPVSKYLHHRSITLTPMNIKYHPRCFESENKKEIWAMVARVQNREGKPVSIHRTYLDGHNKANIKSPKKLMPGTEPLTGSAIRLFYPEDPMFEDGVLGVAEGIETACSVSQIFGVACWATISSSLMVGFEPPEPYRHIIIYGDHDSNFTGHKAAYTLANRLFIKDYLVEVVIPDSVGDWNDYAIKNLR